MHHEDKAREALNLPADLQANIVLSFGYPQPQEQPQPLKKGGRKSLAEIVRWEHWS